MHRGDIVNIEFGKSADCLLDDCVRSRSKMHSTDDRMDFVDTRDGTDLTQSVYRSGMPDDKSTTSPRFLTL
jgi:hypothetical protein